MQASNLICLAVLLSSLSLTPVHADPRPRATRGAQALQQARASYERGAALYEAGRYHEARAAFLRAYQLSGLPALLYNLGLTEERLGDRAAAIAHWEEYLRSPDVPDRAQVRAELMRLKQAEAPRALPLVPAPGPAPGVAQSGARPLRIGSFVTAGFGVAGVVVGAALIAVDGNQDCGAAPRQCAQVLDTQGGGIASLTGGLLLLGTAVVLYAVDHKRSQRPAQLAWLQGAF